MRDDALTVFEAALEAQAEGNEDDEVAPQQLTTEMVDTALQAVTASVFPHRALETQKLWMRRHMKKPAGMTYRLMQAKVLKMNRSLALFPDASQESRFTPAELLELLEFALPANWRAKFDLDGYVPTKHDRARLLRECEAIERSEQQDRKVDNKASKGIRDKSKAKTTTTTTTRSIGRNTKLKFCSEHGPNTTHDSSKCWILHPNLKPSKFEKNESFGKTGKAMKALLKNTTKSELFNMVLESQKAEVSDRPKEKGKGKSDKKRSKATAKPSSSSDESVQQMEEETPPPSDDDSSMEERVAKKKKRIELLGRINE